MKNKILHIGNIANNAYQNAKILNSHGYDNVVLSYDYYHIMGCPEWDDAKIEGEIKNQNFPQWHKVNLHGFERPDWFVAGPLKYCVKYIEARCNHRNVVAWIWKGLVRTAREVLADRASNEMTASIVVLACLKEIKECIQTCVTLLKWGIGIFRRAIKKMMCISLGEKRYIVFRDKIKSWIWGGRKTKKDKYAEMILSIKEKTIREFEELFPDRPCTFKDEIESHIQVALAMKPILKHFDVIIAYATCPIYMYLAGVENYVAYEHGTIRDIPYEDSDLGRLTLLSYAKAKAVYCTNIDCYDSAKYITRKTGTPIVCGLHGIDIDSLIDKIAIAKKERHHIEAMENCSRPLFFCPSRHSWDSKRNSYMKGEDKFLQAASRIARQGYEFTILLVEWGDKTDDIKKIISADEYLCKYIRWIQPVAKNVLYYIYSESDAVVDQFVYKAYGAITFEVLAAGKPVLISTGAEEALEKRFFGEAVPHYVCDEADEIYEAMVEVITKTDKYIQYSENGQAWIKEHHSKDRIYKALSESIAYARSN